MNQRFPRPDRSPSGWQNWRDLLFVHWDVPVDALRRSIPPQLELDLWQGRALVGVVPFAMHGVRPSWLPSAFALDFLETNTRTYVTYRGRPGVYFFSLEASSLLAVKAARWGWGLPYFHATMRMTRGDWFSYETRRRDAHCTARYRPTTMLGPSEEGSFEYFLLERYLLFSVKRDRVFEGQVHHVPYPAQQVELASIDESLIRAAGLERTETPCAVHYASGVDVEVFGPFPA